MKKFIYVFVTMVICSSTLRAAEPSSVVLPFTRLGYDAISLGMGGTSVLNTSHAAFASFQNAALMSYQEGSFDSGIGYQLFQPSGVGSHNISVGVAGKVIDRIGIGVGVAYNMHRPYSMTGDSGDDLGKFTPSDMQVNLGLSCKIIEYLSVGVNLKYLNTTMAKDSKMNAFSSDIFLMTSVKGFKAALGVSSLGTKVKSGENFYNLPTSLTIGLGYGNNFGQHGVEVDLDMDYYFHKAFSAAVGLAYGWNDMVFVRAGYRYGEKTVVPSFASVGLGGKFSGFKIDLAYLFASKAFNNTVAVTLGYTF